MGGGFSPSQIPDAPRPGTRWGGRWHGPAGAGPAKAPGRAGTAAAAPLLYPGTPTPSDLAERGAELLLSADTRPAGVSPSKRFAV